MNTIRSWSVGHRLGLVVGGVLAILLALSVLATFKVATIRTALDANDERNSVIQRHAIDFRGSVHDRAISLRDAVLDGRDLARHREEIERLAAFYVRADERLAQMLKTDAQMPAEVPPLVAAIHAAQARALPLTDQVIVKVKGGQREAAEMQLLDEARPAYTEWLAAINALIDFIEQRQHLQNDTALKAARSFALEIWLATGAAFLLALLVSAWVVRGVLRELGTEPEQLRQLAQRMGSGDLATPIALPRGVAAHSVLAALARMQTDLAALVQQVRDATQVIASGSTQIASGNADLSSRTELTAANLEQTSASMEQLAGTVAANADTALAANQVAQAATQVANEGGAVMSQVVQTMEGIHASSRRIADIIATIDGIAFQTNILALNAAVEAARAGESGRGFAVVAGEVRLLARRSATAAQEIKGLISTSVQQIDGRVQRVGDAGRSMGAIVEQVRQVSELIGTISTSTVEQRQGIGQVNQAVHQLDEVTSANAALVEQSAAAAASLRLQAEQLSLTVARFKLAA